MSSHHASRPSGDPLDRAFAAYRRTDGPHADFAANTSEVVEHDGRAYVVLNNVRGILAVYRIRADGRLERQSDWPEGLEL